MSLIFSLGLFLHLLQDYDDVQVVVLHKDLGVGLGFSLAGGKDQNKPVTVSKYICLKNISCDGIVVSLLMHLWIFSGTQGVSLGCGRPGRLHQGRGPRFVHQWLVTVRLCPLGGPEDPEKSEDSEFGGGGPQEGRK